MKQTETAQWMPDCSSGRIGVPLGSKLKARKRHSARTPTTHNDAMEAHRK